jgi:hypothetical protein
MINVEEKTKRGVKMSKHRKQRDTWGKPNLTEWFLYHTAVGRFYNDFEDPTDRAIIKIVTGLGVISFVVTIYLVIAFVS